MKRIEFKQIAFNQFFEQVRTKISDKITELRALQTPPLEKLMNKLSAAQETHLSLLDQYDKLNDEIAELKVNITDLTKNTAKLQEIVNQHSRFFKKDLIQVDSFQLDEEKRNNVNDRLNTAITLNGYISKSDFDAIAKIILDFSKIKLASLLKDRTEKEQDRSNIDLEGAQENITSIKKQWLEIENKQEQVKNLELKKRADEQAQIEQFKTITKDLYKGKNVGSSATDLLKLSMFSGRVSPDSIAAPEINELDGTIDTERSALQFELRMRLKDQYFNPTSGLFTQFKGFSIFNIFFNLECFKINLECFKFFNHFFYKKTEYISKLETAATEYGVSTTNPDEQKRKETCQTLKELIEEGLREFPAEKTSPRYKDSLHARLSSYQQELEAIFPEDFTAPQSEETGPRNS